MFEWLLNTDRELFITLNNIHTPFFDGVMTFLSAKLVWLPLYLAILFFIFYKRDKKSAFIMLTAVVITFALTDSVANIIKESVQRLRPCYEPALDGVVRLLEGKGGLYGYLSNHASNVFGLATITSLLFRKSWYSITIFIWATSVSYSRIYVGKHYPLDVLSGAILGIAIGLIIYKLALLIIKRSAKCTTT